MALRGINIEMKWGGEGGLLAMLKIKPTWLEQIIAAQDRDSALYKIKLQLSKGKYGDFEIGKARELRINK